MEPSFYKKQLTAIYKEEQKTVLKIKTHFGDTPFSNLMIQMTKGYYRNKKEQAFVQVLNRYM